MTVGIVRGLRWNLKSEIRFNADSCVLSTVIPSFFYNSLQILGIANIPLSVRTL